MVRGKGQKEILSHTEIEGLHDEKRELEQTLKDADTYGKGTISETIDKGAIERQIKRIDNAIVERTPPKVRGVNKDRLAKEAKEIEETLKDGMPTREEMNHPAKNPGAIRKHMRWDVRNKADIERYRTIQRTINPDDPQSVERLRKDK